MTRVGMAGGGARVALVAGFAVLVAARLPGIWPGGRFWAEEGVVYLARAWAEPWWAASVAVHTGYLNLPASLATTAAAHLAPLALAPLVTVLVALGLQLLPAVLLAGSGVAWLRDWRMLGLALLWLALVPAAEEVWLNSITSQFHVTLAVAVLAAAPLAEGRVRWLHRAVLLVAPLCGPVAGALLPLFVLRGWNERAPGRLWQAALLLPGLLVQAAVMLTHPEPAREVAALDLPVVLAAITGKQILLPLVGPGLASQLMLPVAAGRWQALALLAPVLWFGAAGLAAWRGRDPATRWMLAGALLVMAISYGGALTPNGVRDLISPAFGLRYYFVPAVLAGWAALGVAASGRRAERLAAGLLLAWLLAVGAACYTRPAAMMAHGPAWSAEVAAWRADPAHGLAIWPPGWAVRLAPHQR